MYGSRSGISSNLHSRMPLLYLVMPSKFRWFKRGIFMVGGVPDIMMFCSISPIYMVSNYTFYFTSLSSGVPYSFLVVLSIVGWHTFALFCLGRRKRRLLALSLYFSVVSRV